MKIKIIITIVVLFLTHQGIAEEFNGKVLMRINGHEYLMDDLLGRMLISEWEKNRSSPKSSVKSFKRSQSLRPQLLFL